MFTKRLSILLAAGVLLLGIAGMAQAEDKGKIIRSQEQVRIIEQHKAQVRTGDPEQKGVGDQTMTQERTQTRARSMDETGVYDADRLLDQDRDRDRLKDGTGDHDPDQFRDRDQDHDRIHDHMGTGAGSMGGGMRGPRK